MQWEVGLREIISEQDKINIVAMLTLYVVENIAIYWKHCMVTSLEISLSEKLALILCAYDLQCVLMIACKLCLSCTSCRLCIVEYLPTIKSTDKNCSHIKKQQLAEHHKAVNRSEASSNARVKENPSKTQSCRV